MVGVTVVLQDVTRVLRFDELKNDLVATVAHEFRTPLTSLRMAIHLCIEESVGPLTKSRLDLLYAARQDCRAAATIVDDLLDLSRIQSGRMELHRRHVSAESLVREAVVPFAACGARQEPHAQDRALSGVERNRRRHRTDAAGAGQPHRQRRPLYAGRWNGRRAGAPHRHARQSSRWRTPARESPSSTRPPCSTSSSACRGTGSGGAGLGLYIAKEITIAHGARLTLQSEAGQGSRFTIELPAAPGGEPARPPLVTKQIWIYKNAPPSQRSSPCRRRLPSRSSPP